MPIFDKRPNSSRSPAIREVKEKRNMNGKSKLVNSIGQLAEITASKPMGRIRGKDEVGGSRKPKKRGSKPNGLTWQE